MQLRKRLIIHNLVMMLSILIPIYNCDVRTLVWELDQQCDALGIVYEVCLIDDASTEPVHHVNRQLSSSRIKYRQLAQNVGRARIRNLLSVESSYPWLLFLDNDVKIDKPNFISTYLAHIEASPRSMVIVGGRSYQKEKPKNSDLLLHYIYGKKRESMDIRIRQKSPNKFLLTTNLLVRKEIVEQYPFDEEIIGYGYEDILFGAELTQNGYHIDHMDNEVVHHVLKDNALFLADQQVAMRNLATLFRQGKIDNTTLLKTYKHLSSLGLLSLVAGIASKIKRYQLIERYPDQLWLLDMVKLDWFHKENVCKKASIR